MASTKSLVLLVVLVISLAAVAKAQQSCSAQMSGLNVCAPYVVPGSASTNPSAECCGALQAVSQDCLCSTLRIAARLPSECNIPTVTCGN